MIRKWLVYKVISIFVDDTNSTASILLLNDFRPSRKFLMKLWRESLLQANGMLATFAPQESVLIHANRTRIETTIDISTKRKTVPF